MFYTKVKDELQFIPAQLNVLKGSSWLIISVGNIFTVNLDRILLMYNQSVYSTADVIQTYVYRIVFQSTGFPDYSYATAVNVLKSLIAFVLVTGVNRIADKVADARLF